MTTKLETMDEIIVSTYRDDSLAKSNSHEGYKNKAFLEFGLSNRNELYIRGRWSGFDSQNEWVQFSNVSFITIPLKRLIKALNKMNLKIEI